jgi:hypothetical protein
MCAEHSQEEIVVDFDLDTARKRKTVTLIFAERSSRPMSLAVETNWGVLPLMT